MRSVERLTGKELDLSAIELANLGLWLRDEHDIAQSAYYWIRERWMDDLRMYNGWPRDPARVSPRPNAPNLEITVGALACDVICAQIIDLYFQVQPPLTVKPRTGHDGVRQAFQMFVDWMCEARIKLRTAVDNYTLDDVQLGSAVYYCPWREYVRKTDSLKVTDAGPRMQAWPIEDLLIPASPAQSVQDMRWVTLRMWLDKSDLEMRRDRDGWDPDFDKMTVATMMDPLRQRRLELAQQQGTDNETLRGNFYEICMSWCYKDIDKDGIDEDLTVVWDRASGHVLKGLFNEYDSRPIVLGQYQQRAHLPLGLGVLRMGAPYEDEISDIHGMRTDNMYLANNRAWQADDSIADSLTAIWPGKVVGRPAGTEIAPLEMADIYPSSGEAEALTLSYFERRVGMTELSQPNRLGGRTPGVTAITAVQKANQRFTPAFDNHRLATAEAVIQCLYRYQERLHRKDKNAMKDVGRVFDKVEGGAALKAQFLEVMQQDEYDLRDMVDVVITASSVTINRMADQQAFLQLSQIYEKYVAGEVQAAMALDNPQTGPNTKAVIQEAQTAARALMKRIIYTYTQISDWNTFVLDVEPQEQQALALPPQAGIPQIGNAMAGVGGNHVANAPQLPLQNTNVGIPQ